MNKNKALFSASFLAPGFLLYSIFVIIPILFSGYYSLTEWDGASAMSFIGLENYKNLMELGDYWKVLKNSLTLVLYSLIFQVPVSLLLAYILYRTTRGFKIFRAVYFLPVVIAPVTIGLMFTLFYNGDMGALNRLLEFIGLEGMKRNWLTDPKTLIYAVVFPQVWQYIGLYVIIFLAGLQSIPDHIFESARIDGASPNSTFGKIVVPLMWDVIQISIILCATGSLKAFDHVWAMTMGGPGLQSSYLAVFMYKLAFQQSRLGDASAVSITILVYTLVFTVIFKKYFSREAIEF